MQPHDMAQYAGKQSTLYAQRRIALGYTYRQLAETTGIRATRLIQFNSLSAKANPSEVTALAKALLVSEATLREWIVCT